MSSMELYRHFSVEKLRKIAQDLYREKKYDDARIAFDAAIKASNGEDLRLYDNRAATYEKLKDFDAALRDGQRMLRLDKAAVEGYLRTAKILEATDKSELALQIYERGLKYVPVKSEHYPILQKFHDKLTRRLSPPTSVDPFSVLPVELIEMVLKHLPFSQLCQCLRVSKGWHELLTGWPAFFKDLDFASSKRAKAVTFKAIFYYLKLAKYDVTRVVLRDVKLQGTKLLYELAVRCKDLTTLDLHTGGQLRDSLVAATGRAHNLRHLILRHGVQEVDPKVIKAILHQCPLLESVQVDHMTVREHDQTVSACSDQHPSRLKSFSATITSKLRGLKLGDIIPLNFAMTLTNLCLKTFQDRGNNFGRYILAFDGHLHDCLPALEELHVDRIEFSGAGLPHLYRLPPTIRKLTLNLTSSFGGSQGTIHTPLIVKDSLDLSVDYPLLSELECNDWGLHGLTPRQLQLMLDCDSKSGSPKPILKLAMLLDQFHAPSRAEQRLDASQITELAGIKRLKNLQHLRLVSADFDDASALVVAETFKELRSLSVRACRITGVGLKSLVTGLPHLGRVDFDQCAGISGDAIDWARAQGIRMPIQTFVG